LRGDRRSPTEKQRDLDQGLDQADSLIRQRVPRAEIDKQLPAIRRVFGMRSLRLVLTGHEGKSDIIHVEGTVNPSGRRVDRPVPGLYESIDPTEKGREVFRFAGEGITKPTPESREITTTIQYIVNNNVKEKGHITNVFYPDKHELVLKEAFIDTIPAPLRWITAPDEPLVPGRGTPLGIYVNLRHLRKFEDAAAEGAANTIKRELRRQNMPPELDAAQMADIRRRNTLYGALKHVTLDTVENIPTLLKLSRDLKPGVDINQLILSTGLGLYASSTILQAGGQIASAKVVGGRQKEIGALLRFREENASKRLREQVRANHEQLLTDFGATRQTEVLVGFDVHLEIKPFGETA
jgi:hypothetical protein